MGKIVLFFFFGIGTLMGWSQSPISISMDKNPLEVQTDVFGNAYVILEDGAIQKYSPKGTLLAHFRESVWGIPSQLDVWNPLKPIVFYAGKGFIQEFDNNLTPIFQLTLEGGFTRASLVARSSDGNFWWFRERDRTLVKINRSGQILLEGVTLDFMALSHSILPMFLFETMEKNTLRVQLYDPQNGLFTFGANGQLLLHRSELKIDAWCRCNGKWGIWKGNEILDGESQKRISSSEMGCGGIWKINANQLVKGE